MSENETETVQENSEETTETKVEEQPSAQKATKKAKADSAEDTQSQAPAPKAAKAKKTTSIDDIMDTNLVFVRQDAPLEKVYKQMRLSKQDRMPVVDEDDKLLGIIGIFDIIWRMFKEKGIV